jgi:hypothetical protein
MGDNILQERGFGKWVIHLYNPCKEIGPFEGDLVASRDFHTVKIMNNDEDMVVASIPSPNVAYCVDINLCSNYNGK